MKHSTQIARCVSLLSKEYGDPSLGNKEDPIDELVFILLSDRTDEGKCLVAFERLKAQFRHWEDLLAAKNPEIEDAIKYAGLGKRRAELIKRLLRAVAGRFGGLSVSAVQTMSPEDAESELLRLPSVGPKAARCVLLYCFDIPVLPVDVHTYRLGIRLGLLSRQVSYEQSHFVLQNMIPKVFRKAFHVNAVAHGRIRCFASNPDCVECPVSCYCSFPKAKRYLPIEHRPSPAAMDLFAGAGGLSLGFRQAGFRIVQAIEKDPRAVETYRRNHPQTDIIIDDITNLDPLECLARVGLRPGDVTILIGGPPCQGFSESNRRTRTPDNPKNQLYIHFLRFLNAIQPSWFVFENVLGLRTLEHGRILHQIIEDSHSFGYEVAWKELNAFRYGVPQSRRRIFVIGNRLGLPNPFPLPTHGLKLRRPVTVLQAIGDLPLLGNGACVDYLKYKKDGRSLSAYQRMMRIDCGAEVQGNLVSCNNDVVLQRYKHIASGQNWEAIPRNLLDNYRDSSRCHTGIYYRLEWDKPSKVIGNFRKNMLIHPERDRGLSVREAARLQSFPDHCVFLGSIGFQQQQVADSVPPMLAEAVARSIKATIRTSRRSATNASEGPDLNVLSRSSIEDLLCASGHS